LSDIKLFLQLSNLLHPYLFLALFTFALPASAQQLTFPTDVIGNGIGYATTAIKDRATASSNPAALGLTQGYQISAAVRSRFLVDGLYDYGLFGNYALDDHGSIGLQIEHFGFEQFRQQTFAGWYGRQLSEKISLGIRFNYLLISQEEQENASAISGSFGLLYQLNNEITFGLEINPFSPSFQNDVQIPTVQKLGISYQPSDIVSVNADIHYLNNLPNEISIGIGFTYDIFDTVNLGLGYRSNPDQFGFGIGWKVSKNLIVNLSSSFQQRLGASPMGGFAFNGQQD